MKTVLSMYLFEGFEFTGLLFISWLSYWWTFSCFFAHLRHVNETKSRKEKGLECIRFDLDLNSV